MATTLTSTLYPPQFSSTFAPAFLKISTAVRVYFSVSSFNSADDIARVHVSITNQASGENVVNTSTGLLVKNYSYNPTSGRYYIEIDGANENNSEIKGGWKNGQFYKVQLRFDKNTNLSNLGTEAYFTTYSNMFSEWSQVLLLRPISEPTIHLAPFDDIEEGQLPTLNPGILHISGSLEFSDSAETETLRSYTIQVLNDATEEPVSDTVEYIATGVGIDPNIIDYKVNLLNLSNAYRYRLVLTITTKNGYEFSKNYLFALGEYVTEDNFKPDVRLDLSSLERGVVKIKLTNSDILTGGTVYVRRSSWLSNFKDWEILEEIQAVGSIKKTIVDPTVGSGVFYRYAVQMENSAGGMTRTYYAYYIDEDDELQRKQYSVFPDFYDGILYRDGKQISIRYNYKISAVTPNVNRTKMDTIGGKYPKFVENAAMNYKQYSISGLISTQEDEENLFLSKEDFYGDMASAYSAYEENEYRDQYNIENYNYFWEREFREELVKWLNDGEPKLYRSTTEGLNVVMITDVSLTPNATLSRRLWDFSATMYEVADGHSLEALETLGIFHRNLIAVEDDEDEGSGTSPKVLVAMEKPGQLYRIKPPNTNSSSTSLTQKGDVVDNIINYDLQLKYGGVYSNKVASGAYLRNVKIQFLSKPSVYLTNGQNVSLLTDAQIKDIYNINSTRYSGTAAQKAEQQEDTIRRMRVGYAFRLDNLAAANDSMTFFVGEQGYYQIPNSIQVQHLYILNSKDVCTIEYVLCYNQSDAANSKIAYTTLEKTLVSQYRGIFKYGDYLGGTLKKRHSFYAEDYNQKMQWFKGICVEVDPYAILQVQYQEDETYTEFTVGRTGVLHFLKDSEIQNLVFLGRRMTAAPTPTHGESFEETEPWEFREYGKEIIADNIETWHELDGLDTTLKVRIFADLVEYDVIKDGWQSFGDKEANALVAEANRQAALSDIPNPQHNMVYHIQNNDYIYYKDNQFYRFVFDDDTHTTGVARVPIQGYINYYGNVIKNHLV